MGYWCKHYTGLHNKTCSKGHRYSNFGPEFGIANIIPCILRNENPKPCADLERKTQAEIEAEDKKFDEHFKATMAARKTIVDTGAKRGDSGQIECPLCRGKLSYVVSGCNGHIRASCEKAGCLAWIE